MMRHFLLFTILLCALTARSAVPQFANTGLEPITVAAETATGLDNIYVLSHTRGVTVSVTVNSASSATVQTFGMMGAAYGEDYPEGQLSRSQGTLSFPLLEGDKGYAITDGGRTSYFWVVDYSTHRFSVDALNIDLDASDCDRTLLSIDGNADRIIYYSINGRSYTLNRDIELSYTSLTYDATRNQYASVNVDTKLSYISGHINAQAPLCDTYFHIRGDRFLNQWNMAEEATSPYFTATAVEATTSAVQNKRQSENELASDEPLGGSAPAEIEFSAAVTDAAIFTQWQMARDADFENLTFHTSDLAFTYTFTDMGTVYVRFVANNAAGTCEYIGETYEIYIGESRLLCPNAFSPGSTEGVNDEWRVSYKSIVSFECYIFNRWGQKMAEFHDPAQGWDGKVGGKLVPAGVYYYVIKAKGSDGKNYNLSGDINIVGYTRNTP